MKSQNELIAKLKNKQVESAIASLPRLLSLDKSFDSLSQRLEEAARILDLPELTCPDIERILGLPGPADIVIESSPSTRTTIGKLIHTARHEFVLRWLLDKLRKDPDTRKSRHAWLTLYQLLLQLPTATVAKATSASVLLPTIVTTLAHLFPTPHSPTPTPTPTVSVASTNPLPQDKSSKKRKRSSLPKHAPISATPETLDTADSRAIFLTITALLQLLLDSLNHPEPHLHPSVYNQIRSLLTIGHSASATLLSHWLIASLDITSSSADAALLSIALQLVQDLLAIQSISQPDTPDHSFEHLFSLKCLEPAALLLARLQDFSLQDSSTKPASLVSSIHILDRLLAQHLFVPSRTIHHANLNSTTPIKQSPHRYNATLDDRLKNILRRVIQESTMESSANLIAHKKALPHLLDVALRCTPIATPKQRIAQASWFDALFTSMSSILAVNPDSVAAQSLAAMLAVLQTKNLRLSKELLVDLIRTWSGLEQNSLQTLDQPDFQLVAAILAMDPTLFTDIKASHTQALFTALSDFGEDISAGAQTTSEQRSLLCEKIAVPLMRAFAKIRSLRTFLDQWYAQLQAVSSQDQGQWSVWTANSLHASLASALEPSLNIAQIADLLETHRQILNHTFEIVITESTIITQATASTIILSAVVDAMHSDASIHALQGAFESLIQSIQDAIAHVRHADEALTASLLRLLSSLYLLWFPTWSAGASMQAIETQLDTILASPAIEKSLVALEECESAALPRPAVLDASFEIVATICDLMRRLPGQAENVKMLFSAAILSRDNGPAELVAMIPYTVFPIITDRPCLLEFLAPIARQSIFQAMLPLASYSDAGRLIAEALIESLFTATNHAVKDDVFATLTAQHESVTDQATAMSLVLNLSSRGLPRQQREKILDIIADRLLRFKCDAADLEPTLAVIMSLVEAPNATAKISVDPTILWKLACILSSKDCSLSTLDIFAEICTLLLKHILDTKEQERSKLFLEGLSRALETFIHSKRDVLLCPGELRLLTTFIIATESRLDDDALSKLPHRSSSAVDGLVNKVYQALVIEVFCVDNVAQKSTIDSVADTMRAYALLPASFISSGGSSSTKYTAKLENLFISALARIHGPDDERKPSLAMYVQCFKRVASPTCGRTLKELWSTAKFLLGQSLDVEQHQSVLAALSASAAARATSGEVSSLIEKLLHPSDNASVVNAETVSVTHCLIQSVKDAHKEATPHVSVLPILLRSLTTCEDFEAHCELVSCIVLILRSKPTLVTQYTVEATIATAITLLSPSSPALPVSKSHVIFSNICNITRALLQFHRPSLSGRHHILIPLLQRLLSQLFIPASRDASSAHRFKHATWLDSRARPLIKTHGQRVSRLLENLCNPPHSDRSSNKASGSNDNHDLVDLARKAKIQVGQHVQHILHYFCTLILNGRLDDGVRDALQPGLWAIMDVVEIGTDERRGVKSLSASMSNAERAVLRGIWEDWRRFGGWSG